MAQYELRLYMRNGCGAPLLGDVAALEAPDADAASASCRATASAPSSTPPARRSGKASRRGSLEEAVRPPGYPQGVERPPAAIGRRLDQLGPRPGRPPLKAGHAR